jgi:hypothetical protein
LSGGWFTLPVLGIDKIPLLVLTACEFVHNDISVFSINAIRYVHDLVGFFSVSKEWFCPFEELEPS